MAGAVALLGGCASPEVVPATRAGPVPSADVARLEAWKDAERVAAAAPGRAPAVGKGTSMAPLYGDNTMLVMVQVPFEELAAGMVVAYRSSRGHQIVHRLVELTRRGDWRAAGLNNPQEDVERVTRDNLIGVVYASLVHEMPEENDPPR